jgi:hypothetical protein
MSRRRLLLGAGALALLALAAALVVWLMPPRPGITLANCQRIPNGMTVAEVEASWAAPRTKPSAPCWTPGAAGPGLGGGRPPGGSVAGRRQGRLRQGHPTREGGPPAEAPPPPAPLVTAGPRPGPPRWRGNAAAPGHRAGAWSLSGGKGLGVGCARLQPVRRGQPYQSRRAAPASTPAVPDSASCHHPGAKNPG